MNVASLLCLVTVKLDQCFLLFFVFIEFLRGFLFQILRGSGAWYLVIAARFLLFLKKRLSVLSWEGHCEAWWLLIARRPIRSQPQVLHLRKTVSIPVVQIRQKKHLIERAVFVIHQTWRKRIVMWFVSKSITCLSSFGDCSSRLGHLTFESQNALAASAVKMTVSTKIRAHDTCIWLPNAVWLHLSRVLAKDKSHTLITTGRCDCVWPELHLLKVMHDFFACKFVLEQILFFAIQRHRAIIIFFLLLSIFQNHFFNKVWINLVLCCELFL